MNRRDARFILSGLSVFLSLVYIWFIYSHNLKKSSSLLLRWIYGSNIRIYASAIAVLMIFFFLFSFLYEFIEKHVGGYLNYKISTNAGNILTVIFFAIIFCLYLNWLLIEQFNERGVINSYFDHLPKFGYAVLFFMLIAWEYRTEKNEEDISRTLLMCIYGISILWTFLLYYVPNQFCTGGTNDWSCSLIGSVSVTETIYNVADGVPFSNSTTGLYGHYSLFLALPFKILGESNPYSIGIILAVIACIAQLAVLYVIDSFLPKKWLKGLCSFASILFISFYYPACYHIRTFWPAIMCAFLTYIFKKHNPRLIWHRDMWLGIIVSSLSLVWNVETGVACTLAFAMYVAMSVSRLKEKMFIKLCYTLSVSCIIILLSFLIALGIVNLYNIAVGGHLILRDFFYPLIGEGGDYMLDINRVNVVLGNHLWVYILVLLFGTLCASIHKIAFSCRNEENEVEMISGSFSVMGIIAFAYYMNEAAWGATYIVHYILICLCAVLIYKYYNGIRIQPTTIVDYAKKAVYIFILSIISVFAVITINIPVVINEKVETNAYDLSSLVSDIENMKQMVPENTYGVGAGVNVIYHILGWDNHAKYRDTSSMYSSGNNYPIIFNELCQQDSFVIAKSRNEDQLLADAVKTGGYEEIMSFEIGGWEYGYYMRKDEQGLER